MEAFDRAREIYEAEMREYNRIDDEREQIRERREQRYVELAERTQRNIDLGNEAVDELFTERAAA